MTKRFKLGYVCGDFGLIDNDEWIDLHSMSENSEKNVRICIHKMNELSEENEQLKFQLNDCLNHKLFSRRQLEQENEELKQQLKPIQYFADKHGINIFNIEDAFRNCWEDNGKLVTENQELRRSSQDYEDVVSNFFLEHENDFSQELKDEITLLFDIEFNEYTDLEVEE